MVQVEAGRMVTAAVAPEGLAASEGSAVATAKAVEIEDSSSVFNHKRDEFSSG